MGSERLKRCCGGPGRAKGVIAGLGADAGLLGSSENKKNQRR